MATAKTSNKGRPKGTKAPHAQKTREKIQTTKIIQKLERHVEAHPDGPVMSATQIRAAEILLKKTLPDLQTVEIETGDGGGLSVVINDLRGL